MGHFSERPTWRNLIMFINATVAGLKPCPYERFWNFSNHLLVHWRAHSPEHRCTQKEPHQVMSFRFLINYITASLKGKHSKHGHDCGYRGASIRCEGCEGRCAVLRRGAEEQSMVIFNLKARIRRELKDKTPKKYTPGGFLVDIPTSFRERGAINSWQSFRVLGRENSNAGGIQRDLGGITIWKNWSKPRKLKTLLHRFRYIWGNFYEIACMKNSCFLYRSGCVVPGVSR